MTHNSSKGAFEKQLRPGHFLYWQGQHYRLLPGDAADPLTIHLEEIDTLRHHTFRLEELLFANGKEAADLIVAPTLAALQAELEQHVASPEAINIHSLPDHLLQRADAIVSVVETVEKLVSEAKRRALLRGDQFLRTPATKRACRQLTNPVALSTYYKYRRLYHQWGGDRGAIAASLRRSTFNQTQMDQAQLHLIDTLIMRFYARGRTMRPRPITLYRIAQDTLKRTNGLWLDPERWEGTAPQNIIEELLDPKLPMSAILDNPEKSSLLKPVVLPSQSWFYQYLRWFEHQPEQGKAVMAARYGKEVWERELLIFDTFVNRATLPLQYVFADHWLVDVFTVDEATRSQVSRLWLTLLIDTYSRAVLGLALLYEAPCIESIQSALRHAIWPKRSHQELDIEEEWIGYGIPLQLFLDNAWAHHSLSLENLGRVISQGGRYNSIDLIFRPPYKGRYGALIERLFGNFSAQMKELLPGAIHSSRFKDRHNAARTACLLYQDLYRIIHQMIVRYQHTPHHELAGLTPHQKWLDGMQLGLPLVPPYTPEIERLFWRMSPQSRIIGSKGVCAFGLHYWSPELNGLERVGWDGQPIAYNFSYEPSDISRLALFRNQRWVGDVYAKELRLADGSTLPISLWEQKMAKDLARQADGRTINWLAYIQQIDELTKIRLAEKKKARRLRQTQSTETTVDVHAVEAALAGDEIENVDQIYTELLTKFVDHPSVTVNGLFNLEGS